MIRTLLVGLWVCVVALGSTYGSAYWKAHRTADAEEPHEKKLEIKKVKPITVPVISDGELKGYVSAEFSFSIEAADPHDAHGAGGVDPEAFFIDEAFRFLYSESRFDFAHVEKVNVDELKKKITARVNERLGPLKIKEVFVKNFALVRKEDLPH
jgi:flagellar basal body-associated protein FliL